MINPPIHFTQGDEVVLVLTAADGNSNPINLTSATFETLINGANGVGPVTFPNSQHTANANQVVNTGQFTLTLSESDTAQLGVGDHKEILTKVMIGSTTIAFRGFNSLQVYAPVPFE